MEVGGIRSDMADALPTGPRRRAVRSGAACQGALSRRGEDAPAGILPTRATATTEAFSVYGVSATMTAHPRGWRLLCYYSNVCCQLSLILLAAQ